MKGAGVGCQINGILENILKNYEHVLQDFIHVTCQAKLQKNSHAYLPFLAYHVLYMLLYDLLCCCVENIDCFPILMMFSALVQRVSQAARRDNVVVVSWQPSDTARIVRYRSSQYSTVQSGARSDRIDYGIVLCVMCVLPSNVLSTSLQVTSFMTSRPHSIASNKHHHSSIWQQCKHNKLC